MPKHILWVISLNLLILNLGCNKLWPIPNNDTPSQAQTQNEPNVAQTPQGLIGLPLPLSSISKATQADITQVEQIVVELINEDRRQVGLPSVNWDETAAKSARQHVLEEANNGYISHWGLDGEKPQRRYTLAGGLDAVEENESVTLWLEGGFQGVSKEQLKTIVVEHQSAMVNELPPNDGHRQNILDPHHTGVGIAIDVGKFGVAMAQEFTNHYSVIDPLPSTATPGSTVTLKGRIDKGYQIKGIYGVWEPLPLPTTREQLMQTHSYSDPSWDNLHFYAKPQGKGYYISTPSGKVSAQNLNVDNLGNFSISVPLYNSHALDYITVEIAPDTNPKDIFYTAQFVIKL
ncbi:CAP domain-containing protein [Desulfosporosinus fructosivorans]